MRRGKYDDYYDEVYGRKPPRKRRRRRGRGFLLLLVAVLVLAGLYMVRRGGLRVLSVPEENIETEFDVDLDALAARITPEMAVNTLGTAEAAELRSAAEETRGERARMLEFMADNIGIYSEEAYKTAIITPEKTAFALLTPFMSEQGDVSVNIELTPGEIPYLLQYDSRWAYHGYGSSYMGYTACGPTCLSMAALALTGNPAYTPPFVADWAEANGHYVPGAGTAWTLFTTGAAAFGLNGTAISAGEEDLTARLERGEIIVASMLPGDFTTSGHFILIVKSEALGFRVYDPNSMALSRQYWTYDTLAPQIAQLWSLTAA
ncbi:MAG TPA: C39 family peptidase [Candidatus Scatomorpha intestinavium]|uniref:C39 family peptidase n=1 Tax=Candidatus Scatomorpha intestinavium TaxID=2840922 RepID=A0A9D0ZCQ1_9FIRM|nr:C39 family peptidase [Candidatus Scatomorpha intestinavium]